MAASLTTFLGRYYDVTGSSPQDAAIHQFYHELSVISRPDRNGRLRSASTLQGIRELFISSPKLKGYEITEVHEQVSVLECVFAVVVGLVRDEKEVPSSFVQSFVLVPRLWHSGGVEEEGLKNEHPYIIQNDALILFGSGDRLKQVVMLPSGSPVETGRRKGKYQPRTFASVVGRCSPPGPGSFPPLSSSNGGKSFPHK